MSLLFGEVKKKYYFCSHERKVGRVTECAGLEIRYTPFGYRGFESLTFRYSDKTKAQVKSKGAAPRGEVAPFVISL